MSLLAAQVIAHRLSTIRNANCIAVVYRGQVLEKVGVLSWPPGRLRGTGSACSVAGRT